MKRGRAPLAPGHVRRLSPTVCVAEPFAGSTADDIVQLQWLVKAERLERRIKRQWQRQSRTLQREMRLWLRDARRHQQQHRRR